MQLSAGTQRRVFELPFLAFSGFSAALIYGALLLYLPLLRFYRLPLKNLNHIPPAQWELGLVAIVCILTLFGAYAFGALGVADALQRRGGRLLILGFPLLFVVLLFLAYPITSTDVYDYLFRGRMLARYEANTFVTIPRAYTNDPLLRFVAWKHVVTAYGPVWEGISWLTARLAGEAPGASAARPMQALLRLIVAYKLVGVLGFLLCGLAIFLALHAAAPEQRWLGLYLWLWNPLALWESVAAAHNDVWMVLGIVVALALLTRAQRALEPQAVSMVQPQWPGRVVPPREDLATRRPGGMPASIVLVLLALIALTLGGLVKYVAFFAVPLILAAALRRTPTWRERGLLTALVGVVCVGLIVLAYAPFWVGFETLQNIRDRRSLFNASWLTLLRSTLMNIVTAERAEALATTTGLILLVLGIAYATWRAWRRPAQLTAIVLGLILWFLFVCNPWFLPWYVLWVLPLAALLPWDGRVVRAIGIFCCVALFHYIADGLLLPLLGLSDKSFAREGLLAGLLYLPPLLALGWRPLVHLSARQRLWLYGIWMSGVLLAFALRYPLGPNSGRLTDIGKLAAYKGPEFVGYVVGMAVLFGLYLLALHEARRLPNHQALPIVVIAALPMAAAMIAMYPVNAIDLFLYAVRSRLLTSYGADPNATLPVDFGADVWQRFITAEWADNTSPYGPLWNLLAAPFTAFVDDNILAALLGFKLLMALSVFAGALIIGHTLRVQGRDDVAVGVLFWLWNPLLLWEGIGNAHNDVVLVLPLLLALWAFLARRDRLVVPLLVVAALIKFVTLLLIPLAALALWRRSGGGRAGLRLAAWSALLSLGILALGLFPFYDLGALWSSIVQQGDVFYTGPVAALAGLLDNVMPKVQAERWLLLAGQALFLLALAWQSLRVWRDPEHLPQACFETLFVFLLVAVANLRPWYGIWLVALAAMLPWPGVAWRTIAWTVGGLASYAFLIWIAAWWKPDRDLLIVIATLIMVGPALLASLPFPRLLAARLRARHQSQMLVETNPTPD